MRAVFCRKTGRSERLLRCPGNRDQGGQESTVDFRLVRLVPKREKGSAIAPSSSHTADANAARPEWFNVRAADLGGTLYDAAGHPIAGARVTLVSTDADGSKRKELKATT